MFKGISKLLSFTKKVRPDRRTEVRHCGFSQRKYYTKGISPLLATVLLIAATVVTTTMLSGWVSTTMSTTQSTVGNKTSEGVACAAAEIVIDDVYSGAGSGSVARAIVRNSGGSDNLAITSAQLYDKFGNNFTTTNTLPTNLNKGQMATLNFNNAVLPTTTNDSARGINNGTLENNATYTLSGKYGSALSLVGLSDFFNTSFSQSLNLSENMTVSAWIKANSFSSDSWRDNIVTTERNTVGFTLRIGTGVIDFVIGNDDWPEVRDVSTVMQTNQWYHLAGWANRTQLRVYIDGIFRNSTQISSSMKPSTLGVMIGDTSVFSVGQRNFNGTVDDVAIWNRSLTNDEINTSMNQGPLTVSNINDLVGYWKFDEGKGMLSCPSDFSRVVVTTNCGGVSAEFSKRPKC